MPATGQHPYHDYFLQSKDQAASALAQMMQARPRLEALNIPVIKKMYERRIAPLSAMAGALTGQKPAEAMQSAMIRLLSLELVQSFLQKPDDPETLDALVEQCALILAACGKTTVAVAPYTQSELEEITRGLPEYYSDITFLSTMFALVSTSPNSAAEALFSFLSPARDGQDIQAEYSWDDIVLASSVLHALWSYFPQMPAAGRKLLLQHHFYQAIVFGVPVRFWLSEAAGAADMFRELTVNNEESVRTSATRADGRRLIEVVKQYFSAGTSTDIEALARQKFVDKLYTGQSARPMYAAWLGDALGIITQLRLMR